MRQIRIAFKEEALGENGDQLEVEENEVSGQQLAEEPDGSAAGSAVPSKAPSKLSVRSSATKDAVAEEEGAAEDAKGSRLSVRSLSIHTRGCCGRVVIINSPRLRTAAKLQNDSKSISHRCRSKKSNAGSRAGSKVSLRSNKSSRRGSKAVSAKGGEEGKMESDVP